MQTGSLIMNPDPNTSAFYDQYAAGISDETESPRSAMLPHIEREIARGAAVLDVGAGSGRDMAAMLACGLDAFGVEPNEAMRAKALARHPALHGRLRSAALPALGLPFEDLRPQGFDAVVCSAVLMHLDAVEMPAALEAMVGQLRAAAGSTLLLALPEMDRAWLKADRDRDDRKFHNHSPDDIRDILGRAGLVLERSFTSDIVLKSAGSLWHTLVFRRLR